jgi:hypothetical protein
VRLELIEEGKECVRVQLLLDPMHNEFKTQMATQGWESELGETRRWHRTFQDALKELVGGTGLEPVTPAV